MTVASNLLKSLSSYLNTREYSDGTARSQQYKQEGLILCFPKYHSPLLNPFQTSTYFGSLRCSKASSIYRMRKHMTKIKLCIPLHFFTLLYWSTLGARWLWFPRWCSGKEPACQCRRHETQVWSLGQEDPLEEEMATPPIFLPGEPHGQRSLVG